MCSARLAPSAAIAADFRLAAASANAPASGEFFSATTGIQNVDALLFGTRWNSTKLTYAFPDSAGYYPAPYQHEPGVFDDRPSQLLAVTPQLATAFRAATRTYQAISALRFTEVAPNAPADLTAARVPRDFTADARFPTWANEGDIWFNHLDYNTPIRGAYAWLIVLHEVGHGLGLKHGHQGDQGATRQALAGDSDAMEFSIMTYRSYAGGGTSNYTNEQWGYAQTPMMYDIAAIQHIYGANFATNAGNSLYRFSSATGEMFINGIGQGRPGANRIFLTVWDGNGNDTYDFSNYATGLQISLAPGGWSLLSSAQRADLGNGHVARGNVYNALLHHGDARSLIENANGGAGNDTIAGNQAANTLSGNNGNDMLVGQGGNDRLSGGDGNDVLRGGTGNDVSFGGPGVDQLFGDLGNDMLIGGAGADRLVGGGGTDTASHVWAPAGVTASLANSSANTGEARGDIYSAIQNLQGSAHADRLFGSAGVNVLDGLGGNDTLVGGAAADRLVGGTGIDTASYVGARKGVVASLVSPSSNSGDAKGDIYVGVENLAGSGFADTLIGNAGANTLSGGSGGDRLSGGTGNDALSGGAHNDVLSGGPGNDVFLFNTLPSATNNMDVITDFDVVNDIIWLENAIFRGLAPGVLPSASFFKSAAGLAHDANDRIIYETDTGALFYDANGSAAGGATQFAKIGAGLALTNADFVVG